MNDDVAKNVYLNIKISNLLHDKNCYRYGLPDDI